MVTRKITTMRSFAESPCNRFVYQGKAVGRKDLEKMTYRDLKYAVTHGKVEVIIRR